MATRPRAVVDDSRGAGALAGDGTIVTIRPVLPDDRAALVGFYGAASGSLSVRLLTVAGRPSDTAEIDELCLPETGRRLAVVMLNGTEIVGLARCCWNMSSPSRAGPASPASSVTPSPATGRWHAGCATRSAAPEPGGSAVSQPKTPGSATSRRFSRAVGARDRPAGHAWLRPLLAPRSVAVIGGMQRRGRTGFETVRALKEFGFRGRLYPVNGTGRPVCGVPGYRTIAALPRPVDLLVVAVPADRVSETLREAGRKGVHSAILLGGGPRR